MKKVALEQIYYSLVRIRRFEEKIVELYPEQEMCCPVHLYIGQEAVAAGVCANLNKRDHVFSNHRNHGHLVAKGADLKYLFAEIYGKKTGCSEGKGGSMHMIASECSILGTSAIVGGGIPISVGAALASKMKKEDKISVVFFGDGAADSGVLYESLNFAALRKLPLLFVCENNFYATNSPQRSRQVNPDIYKISGLFSLPGFLIDGNDVFEVYNKSKKAIEKIRKGRGPALIEARTYRWQSHVGPQTDIEKGLRKKEEVEKWLKKCPLKRFKKAVEKDKLMDKASREKIENLVEREITEALEFASNSPYPKKQDLYTDVY